MTGMLGAGQRGGGSQAASSSCCAGKCGQPSTPGHPQRLDRQLAQRRRRSWRRRRRTWASVSGNVEVSRSSQSAEDKRQADPSEQPQA